MKLLVGYGNTLRQDDGVGWWVAGQLAPDFDEAAVQVVQAQQLMPEVAAAVAACEGVVFVDAAIEGQPGEVRVQPIQPAGHGGDVHALTPPQILYLARYLYDKCPVAYLVTITGARFDLGEGFSDAVQAAIPQAIAEIRHLLASDAPYADAPGTSP